VINLPFRQPGRFYRGNLHTHTTSSDGRMAVAEVVGAYAQEGYDFVAVTDHFSERYGFLVTDTTALRRPDFTTILGAELHAPALANGERWHIVAVGLPLDFAPTTAEETGPALAARAAAAGAFVGLAHPAWYGLSLDDARSIETAHAVEVYNETCTMLSDRGESWYVLDSLLSEGRRLTAFGSDDAHFRNELPDTFGAWVWVRAESLEPDALMAALKAGHFYTTQGPRLHDIRIEGAEIDIHCSPAVGVFVAGAGHKSARLHGRGITRCRFPLDQFDGSYCRVTVIDAAGKRAWSNPIWLDA
jgi:predicted metal-dependent phosphoesterase TrpH